MENRGRPLIQRATPVCVLATHAHQFPLPFLLGAQCPLEHREGCGLGFRLRPLEGKVQPSEQPQRFGLLLVLPSLGV